MPQRYPEVGATGDGPSGTPGEDVEELGISMAGCVQLFEDRDSIVKKFKTCRYRFWFRC